MEIYVMILVNVAIFIIGLFFGSFYTLARYRIPKSIDIVKKPSFCPKCNHKLGLLEQIPVLSYLISGGKCVHCKKKIDNKYLFTEIFTGIMFLIIYNVYNLGVIMLNLSGFRVLDTLSILSILRNTIYI
jgi:possible prepilin peptidase